MIRQIGRCLTCHWYEGLYEFAYCNKLKVVMSVSRNTCHPGLIFRPSKCAHLQHYKEKGEE